MVTNLLRRLVLKTMASRPPDFIVGTTEDPYMLRWYFLPRNKLFNIYFHEFVRSDDPRALHDHPWFNISFLVEGAYLEHTIENGGINRLRRLEAGAFKIRGPRSAHRVELINDITARTIFITGPVIREWGFHCRKGWRSFKDFVAITRGPDGQPVSEIGAGCGELD